MRTVLLVSNGKLIDMLLWYNIVSIGYKLIYQPDKYFYFTEEVSQHLAGVSGVVEILLKHATNDELSNDVKQNAAICLAKLATADKRYCNITHKHCFSVTVYMRQVLFHWLNGIYARLWCGN